MTKFLIVLLFITFGFVSINARYGIFNTIYNFFGGYKYKNECAHFLAGYGKKDDSNKENAWKNYKSCLFKWANDRKIKLTDYDIERYFKRDESVFLSLFADPRLAFLYYGNNFVPIHFFRQ